jgi:hypothetical protein
MRRHGASITGAGGRLLVGAVVAGASPSAASGPDRVKAAGTLVWCTDTGFPQSRRWAPRVAFVQGEDRAARAVPVDFADLEG